jgi:8-oxo-dGTP diphosphatase
MKKGVDYIGICVVFYCHDGKGNVILAKRGVNARDEQGTWDIGGGGMELHGTVEGTLRNEIQEEYNCSVINLEFLGYRDVHRLHDNKKTHWIALDFKVLVDVSDLKNNEPHKFDEVKLFPKNQLPQPFHSQLQNFFNLYQEKIK